MHTDKPGSKYAKCQLFVSVTQDVITDLHEPVS